jgi:membrane-bound lytic murein transglycosylase D
MDLATISRKTNQLVNCGFSLLLLVAFSLGGCDQLNQRADNVLSSDYNGKSRPADSQVSAFTANTVSNSVKPRTESNLWDYLRVNSQLGFEHISHQRLKKYQRWHRKHPTYLHRINHRAKPYLHYIVTSLEARNMPIELALLPLIESDYNPNAYSHARAAGLWQIIPTTGTMLGLEQNWWYDGRRDVVASTQAALDFLQKLHKRYQGDWLLALAAYNSGPSTVNRALRSNRQQGLATDFWSLSLPEETSFYIPQLIVLIQLIKAPEKYDTTLPELANQPYFQQVDINSQMELNQVAALTDATLAEIQRLNPGFKHRVTAPEGPHNLLVPVAQAKQLTDRLAQLPAQQRVSWHRYQIKQGDSLSRIAHQFNTSISTIKRINQLDDSFIRVGYSLLIPQAKSQQLASNTVETSNTKKPANFILYQVRQGDTLSHIAKQQGVSVKQLLKWNPLAADSQTLSIGQRLIIGTQSVVASTCQQPNPQQLTS